MDYKSNIKRYGILTLSLSLFFYIFRYVPHPPNFTPVIAVTLYTSIFFGSRSLPFIILAYAITDFFIGFHNLLLFTWGSLTLIGIFNRLYNSFFTRIIGIFLSSLIFFIFTNFGVWVLSDMYSNNIYGLISCYIMAIPFFANTLISTMFFGLLLELFILCKKKLPKFYVK